MSYKKLRGDFTKATVVRFTAASDVSDGDVVVDNGRVGVVHDVNGRGVEDGDEGLMIVGTDEKGIYMPKAAGTIDRHDILYWSGSGVTATAGSNTPIGRAVQDAASGDDEALVELTNIAPAAAAG